MISICSNISESKTFQRLILFTILLAGVTVGIQTYKDFAKQHEAILLTLDTLILGIFTLEVLIKITAEGKNPKNTSRMHGTCLISLSWSLALSDRFYQ